MHFTKSSFPLKIRHTGEKGAVRKEHVHSGLLGFVAFVSFSSVKQKKFQPSQSVFTQVQVNDNLCKFRLFNELAAILYLRQRCRTGSELLSSSLKASNPDFKAGGLGFHS